MTSAHRWHERRAQRRSARDLRRGGGGRGPVALQRCAHGVAAAAAEVRYRAARAVRGDRPMLVALAGVLVLGAIVLSGPAQSYLDARERLETLEVKAEALDDANATLEQRVADLNDPTSIELLAREQQGFVRPGEVAYSLIPPEVERPRITGPRHPALSDPDPWHERAWTVISGWFGA